MPDSFLILAGLATLIASADLLVRGAVWAALSLGISKMMVGLTLVAFGTSAPELMVSLTAALKGSLGIATGNVLGSNIANIGLIVGLSALLSPISHAPGSARFELRYVIFTSLLVLLPIATTGEVERWHGAVFVGLLAFFTWHLTRREQRRRRAAAADERAGAPHGLGSWLLHLGFIALGFVGLVFGSDWLVDGAAGVARDLGLSETMIGMSIIAVGTSLPELATSAVAARRGHPEIALGNVLGSNIFNLCMVLGVTALVRPLPVSWAGEGTAAILAVLMAVALALLLRYRGRISRAAGGWLLGSYLGYMALALALE